MSKPLQTGPARTFAEIYCERRGIARGEFERAVLEETLYPWARVLRGLVEWLSPDYFKTDLVVIREAGAMTRAGRLEAGQARYHARVTEGWWRKQADLRISIHCLAGLMRDTLPSSWREGRLWAQYPNHETN